MKRTLKPGILLTLGAVAGTLGCTGFGLARDGEVSGNPLQPRAVVASFPQPPFVDHQVLEGRDEEQRQINHGGGRCWVDLPFEAEPDSPWQAPPNQAVVCPTAILEDPAFAACEYGEVHISSAGTPTTCECYYRGNPPPPAKEIPCPIVAIPAMAAPIQPDYPAPPT